MTLFLKSWTECIFDPSHPSFTPLILLWPAVKTREGGRVGAESATETEIKDVRLTAADRAATHSVTDGAFALEILLYDGHGGSELLKG